MAAGAGAPARSSPIGTFEISAVTLRPPSARSSPARRRLQHGWASSELWCACRSAVSRWILPPKGGPAASLRMLSGRSPRSADRFARTRFRAQKVTTLRCKRRFRQATAGKATLDELFELGIERDNDLWLRGHAGTFDNRKGAAPLGRRFFVANWEMDKNLYQNGFFTVKLGPFLDSGTVADSSSLFGSRRWLWDAGAQCKVRVLGSLTIVLSYGRDLRGGKGVFYGTVLH